MRAIPRSSSGGPRVEARRIFAAHALFGGRGLVLVAALMAAGSDARAAPSAPPAGESETATGPNTAGAAPTPPPAEPATTSSAPATPAAPAKPATVVPLAAPRAHESDPVLALYLQRMHSAGLLDNREATMEEVEDLLARAQDRHVRGDDLGSATLLLDLLQNPRFASVDGLPVMTSAQYHLGLALESFGALDSAGLAFDAVLAAGPVDNSYFRPALRRRVDLALDLRDYSRALADIQARIAASGSSASELAEEDADELDYLQARTLEAEGRFGESRAAHERVGPRSRFHTASLYLSGVLSARAGEYRRAEEAFCRVVGGPANSTAVYYVDGRYFPVRDLAQLGLGRVAHEERRHSHAFYHYFQIPQESEHLPAALFESAWTMAERGEYVVARGLIAELRERFPDAPQTVEARLLDALLRLYDCDFRSAEAAFTRFIDELAPVADHVDEIRADRARVRELHRELTRSRSANEDLSGEAPAHRLLLYMVDEDPSYARLSRRAEVLRREASVASSVEHNLWSVRDELLGQDTSADHGGREPLAALDAIDRLEDEVAALDAQIRAAEAAGADADTLADEREELVDLRRRASELRASAADLARGAPAPGVADAGDLVAAVNADLAGLAHMRMQATRLATELDDQAAALAAARLGQLRARIDDLMGEARMGRIDAVLGAKKKLEIEVQSMAAGRFPSELFGKLQIEGMVGDDEEFWPYQGEYWADEYEGYR